LDLANVSFAKKLFTSQFPCLTKERNRKKTERKMVTGAQRRKEGSVLPQKYVEIHASVGIICQGSVGRSKGKKEGEG
jgi:hypothetical protein